MKNEIPEQKFELLTNGLSTVFASELRKKRASRLFYPDFKERNESLTRGGKTR